MSFKNKIQNNLYKNCDICIFIFFIISLVVDNINGLIMQTIGFETVSLGQISRILFILYFLVIDFFFLSSQELVEIIKKYFFVIFIIFLPLIYFFNHSTFMGLINDYLYLTKLFYFFLITFSLKLLYDKKIFSVLTIDKIINTYTVLAPLTIILPYICGIGFEAYTNSGYRGFYYANNEINIVLICTYILTTDNLFENFSFKYFSIYVINIVGLLLIGSKTSIIVIILTLIIYLYKFRKKIFYNKNRFFAFICSIGIIFIIFKKFLSNIIERLIFFYDMLVVQGNGTFITFLLSNRDKRLAPAFFQNFISNDNGILNFFVGIGNYAQTNAKDMNSLMELDFFDTFLWFGIFMACLVLFLYIKIIYTAFRYRGLFKYKFCYIIVFAFSLIAGHVWFSALSATMFSLIAAKLILREDVE